MKDNINWYFLAY